MIPSAVKNEIQSRLRRAESEHGVKVVLTVESGSRAWGFASPNSDYDARFIYVHQPDWYLAVNLEEKRDVIEYPIVDDLDVNGWDLRKALRLFWRSNPGFVEWIQSPILYETATSFHAEALRLLPDIYSVEAGIYHYRSMAKTTYRGHLQESLVPLKKYFYVLRPLLAVRWLERFGKHAPIEFGKLLTVLEEQTDLLEAIHELLEIKRTSPEMGLSRPVPAIQRFIESELLRLEQVTPQRSERLGSVSMLSDLFRTVLRDAWAPVRQQNIGIITPAEIDDAEEILSLQKRAYESEAKLYNDWNIPPLTQSLDSLKAEILTGGVLKYSQSEGIVGSVRALLQDGKCEIGRLMVAPEFQGQGIGSALLAAIEARFPQARSFELFTGSRSEVNIRFYRRRGYEIVTAKALSPAVTFVFMSKPQKET